jgi:hypothetical protein
MATAQDIAKLNKQWAILLQRVADRVPGCEVTTIRRLVQEILEPSLAAQSPMGFDLIWEDVWENDLRGGEYIELVCSRQHHSVYEGRLAERPEYNHATGRWSFKVYVVQLHDSTGEARETALLTLGQDESAVGFVLPKVLRIRPNAHWRHPQV